LLLELFQRCPGFVQSAKLRRRNEVILPSMSAVINTIADQAKLYSSVPMLARTHGQPASPTTVGKELANFAHRLRRHQLEVERVSPWGKFNGATGNFSALAVAYPEVDWPSVSQDFIQNDLGLSYTSHSTQIEPHDWLAELMHATCRFNSTLLDFDRDMWGYISLGYFKQRAVAGEIGSSTMPHKVNPIAFENSEGNIGMANAIMGHLAEKLLVSRYQRDLSDSTVLRSIGVGFAHSLISYKQTCKGLSRISANQERLDVRVLVGVIGRMRRLADASD
jgi:adenylosuccinate lyase